MAVTEPQTPPQQRAPGRTQNRRRLIIVGLVVLAALGLLVVRGLGNATLYFRTADEAVAQKRQLGTKRFRIEGTVVAGTVKEQSNRVAFNIESKGVVVPVSHQGDPPELFKPGIPVVLEGNFQGDTFDSDRIMVKHSEDYIAQHPNRVTVPPSTVP